MIHCADQLIAGHKKGVWKTIPFIVLLIGLTQVFPKAGPWLMVPMMVMVGYLGMARIKEVRSIPCPSCGGSCRMDTDRASVMKLTCESCGETHDTDCVYYRGIPRRRF